MKKFHILCLLSALLLPTSTQAESLSGFINSCKNNKVLQQDGLSELGDIAGAFYCRGFITGYYLGLLSNEKVTGTKCTSTHVNSDQLIKYILSSYEVKITKTSAEQLSLFKTQPPEWFVEKSIISFCAHQN